MFDMLQLENTQVLQTTLMVAVFSSSVLWQRNGWKVTSKTAEFRFNIKNDIKWKESHDKDRIQMLIP